MPSIILLYHGVTRSTSVGIENFSGKHIHADEFEKQMKYLANNQTVVSLKELAKAPGRNVVAITFDDSYKNVYEVAVPILRKYNIPATFFISTDFVDNNKLFWTDKLEHMINFSRTSMITNWLMPFKSVFPVSNDEEKIETAVQLKEYMKVIPQQNRITVLAEIEKQTGFQPYQSIDNYKTLSWNDIKNISADCLFDIGGHTASHEILAQMNKADYTFEIQNSIATLEHKLNKKIDLFSYPEGQEQHYNDDIITCLKECGIAICPSAIYGVNRDDESLFHLKRIMVNFMGCKFPFKIKD